MQKPEPLPMPKRLDDGNAAPEDGIVRHAYYRRSRYEVWQYYGVDRTGHFRPRVILAPYGSYYLYNGEAFPWVSTHQSEFMPYVSDVP